MSLLRRFALALCLLSSLEVGRLSAQQAGISGEWDGTIAGRLRVIVRIDHASDNSWRASLESVDQGHVKIDIDEVSFDGKKALQLEMKKIGASYKGEFSADNSELVGTWEQGGAAVPLTLRRPGAAPAELKPATRGRIALKPCTSSGGQALCGSYEVFENRSTQAGRKIALRVMVLPATADKPASDAVFGFGGGPGQAASEAYPLAPVTIGLRKQHDVVLIDQRGTGQSNPLRCPFDNSSAQALLNGPSSVKDLPGCRKDLESRADLTQYTTSIAADDFDEIREAMGYSRIDLLGGSYGTLAALIYLRRHGDHVRSVVLEGVAPPDYRLPLPFAKTIQSSLQHLFAKCAADAACHKDYPDLKSEFETVVKRLEAVPATFQFGSGEKAQTVTLERGAFVSDLRPMLYAPAIVRQLPYILHRAFEKDFQPFATAATLMRRAVNMSVARGLAFSVDCSEALPFITEADIKRETEGTYLGDYDVKAHQKTCSAWPRAEVPKDFLTPVHSDVPVLLISGEDDPATPPWLARHAAEGLSKSRIVAIPNGTHLTASQCVDGIAVQFIDRGSDAGLDTSCVNQVQQLPFLTLKQANGGQ